MSKSKILKTLKVARCQIDGIDKQIIILLSKRMAVSTRIGTLKKRHKIPIIQRARWTELTRDRLTKSKKLRLNPKVTNDIFRIIQKESIAIQRKVKSR